MVFPNDLHCCRDPLCGAPGIAVDLVASADDAWLEDRTHHRDPRAELGHVPSDYGVRPDPQGVFQVVRGNVRRTVRPGGDSSATVAGDTQPIGPDSSDTFWMLIASTGQAATQAPQRMQSY